MGSRRGSTPTMPRRIAPLEPVSSLLTHRHHDQFNNKIKPGEKPVKALSEQLMPRPTQAGQVLGFTPRNVAAHAQGGRLKACRHVTHSVTPGTRTPGRGAGRDRCCTCRRGGQCRRTRVLRGLEGQELRRSCGTRCAWGDRDGTVCTQHGCPLRECGMSS